MNYFGPTASPSYDTSDLLQHLTVTDMVGSFLVLQLIKAHSWLSKNVQSIPSTLYQTKNGLAKVIFLS